MHLTFRDVLYTRSAFLLCLYLNGCVVVNFWWFGDSIVLCRSYYDCKKCQSAYYKLLFLIFSPPKVLF